MKRTFIFLLLSIFLISACTSIIQKQPAAVSITVEETEESIGEEKKTTENLVEITSSGFNPSTLTINAGETVVFINKEAKAHWPASAVHPTHEVYPEPGGCIGSKFDACRGLKQKEEFSFTFNQKGTWRYHDHLNPGLTGSIVVK